MDAYERVRSCICASGISYYINLIDRSLCFMVSPAVEFAGYTIPHPSEFIISIRVQTNGIKSAVDAFHDALDNLMDLTLHIKVSSMAYYSQSL